MKVIDLNKIYSGPKPTVQFTDEAFIKMIDLVHTSDIEVQWHALVKKEDDNNYTVYDILVYPQIATAATVTSDDEAYAMWMMELTNKQLKDLRMQGHSHVNFGVNPSGTDMVTFNNFLTQVNDYYIFIIVNKKLKMHIELYDVENNVMFTNEEIKLKIPYTWGHYKIEQYVTHHNFNATKSKSKPEKGALKNGHEEIPRFLQPK